MKINISGLSEGVHQYERSAAVEELKLDSNFTGDVTASITLEKSIHQILLRVNASVKGLFVCDRCADEFSDVVSASFVSVYTWEQGAEQDENDDYFILGKEDNIIDISDSVSEYIRLGIPVKLLCKNNCTIPEFVSVKKPAVDPRWEKLQSLLRTEKN